MVRRKVSSTTCTTAANTLSSTVYASRCGDGGEVDNPLVYRLGALQQKQEALDLVD
jgi:hypothetical protein